MNILASYNWLKEYLKTSLSPEDFARELSLRSMSVEKIENLQHKFAHMVVGVIKEIKAHPNANKLRIAVTDIGEKTVEIVCGGSNLLVGQRVFVALPGAVVKWHGEGDDVTLSETEIRGVKSFGMICAPAEVGFEKLQAGEHEIWDLSLITDATAGTPIAEALGLADTVFDIEITSNRPDCMSVVGLAREGGVAVSGSFTEPVVPALLKSAESNNDLRVVVESKKCPRYLAAVVKNVQVGPSPWWLQKKLLLAGHKPINNLVDITNLVLHEFGQPLHVFDASKIEGRQLVIRDAKRGEKLLALDGKEYSLDKNNLIIADASKPLAVAGVMGGAESGVTSITTDVIFEAASFDPVSVRRTARALNLYSDSQLVFEKGLSTEALPLALARAVQLAEELAHGRLSGVTEVEARPYKARTLNTSYSKIRSRLGVDVSDGQIESILSNLGFVLDKKGASFKATVPYWRDHDLENEVDLTEEVARMYGYHNMPSTLPQFTLGTGTASLSITFERRVKEFLRAAGFTEFFSLSLLDKRDLEKYGLSPLEAVKVFNPLTEELAYLRPSLIPGLLRDIERNQAQIREALVFELSRIYRPVNSSELSLPTESARLILAHYGFSDIEPAFMAMRGVLENFGQEIGLTFKLNRLEGEEKWHQTRSALVSAILDGQEKTVGVFGQVSDVYAKAFGLEVPVLVIDLDFAGLVPNIRSLQRYEPISEFPVSKRDISFVINEHVAFEQVLSTVKESSLVAQVSLSDIYRDEKIGQAKKSLTLALTFAVSSRTLTGEEVETAMQEIVDKLIARFGAHLRV